MAGWKRIIKERAERTRKRRAARIADCRTAHDLVWGQGLSKAEVGRRMGGISRQAVSRMLVEYEDIKAAAEAA